MNHDQNKNQNQDKNQNENQDNTQNSTPIPGALPLNADSADNAYDDDDIPQVDLPGDVIPDEVPRKDGPGGEGSK